MPLTYCSENKGEYARDTELSFSRCFCSVSGVKEKKKKPNSVAHIKIIFLHFISSTSFVPEAYSKWRLGERVSYIFSKAF